MLIGSVQKRLLGAPPDMAALRVRLRAWWEGEVPDPPVAEPEPPAEPVAAPRPAPAPDRRRLYWTPERIEIAQRVWGREHLTPGGEAFIRALLKPLALDPSLTVAEIGCGLGGATRLMHKGFGIWPKGFEPCPELAEAAVALSTRAGLAKKAPIAGIDLQRLDLKRGAFDRLILRDVLHLAEDKLGLLGAMKDALKKRGQILLTDFVLRDDDAPPPAVGFWAAHEPTPSRPWSLTRMTEGLEDLKLTVHIMADETAELRAMILEGWKTFQTSLRGAPLPPELTEAMFDEGERWARCAAALDSGALLYYRVIASR